MQIKINTTSRKTVLSKSILSLIATALIIGASSVPAASSNNATSDFSVGNGNPNGVWSYGWLSSDWSSFTLFSQTRSGSPGPGWYNSSIDSWVWLNTSGGTQYGVSNGWLALSPGSGNQDPVLRWTATEGGSVQVTGEFQPGDSATMDVAIFQGNLRTVGNTLWSATNAGSFNLNVNVSLGDSINFTIDGPFANGNTPINATISTVPEPSTMALLIGAGTLAIAIARRRNGNA